jgi:RNA polymerase sigma factor (TIGR02999 family)
LIHEAFLRLAGPGEAQFENRRHFFGAAARAMRQIRVDAARERNRLKHGGGRQPVALDHEPAKSSVDPSEVLAIDEALTELEQTNPRAVKVVELRYFAGATGDETAEALGIAPSTVDSDWAFAKAWLHRKLSGSSST